MVEEFQQRLSTGEVVLLDGGTGTELEARGIPMNGAVWCGVAVLEHQDVVRTVHEDYIRAGAEIITANTFPSNRLALEPAGFGDRVAEINRRAVETALQARENAADRPVLVAGSLTPHSAEGIPDPHPDAQFVLACFREQATVQAEAGVDLFALEMIPSAFYGRPAAQAAAETGLPFWLGMTTWSGEGGWEQEGSLAALVSGTDRARGHGGHRDAHRGGRDRACTGRDRAALAWRDRRLRPSRRLDSTQLDRQRHHARALRRRRAALGGAWRTAHRRVLRNAANAHRPAQRTAADAHPPSGPPLRCLTRPRRRKRQRRGVSATRLLPREAVA